jgi:hypothetical protein
VERAENSECQPGQSDDGGEDPKGSAIERSPAAAAIG